MVVFRLLRRALGVGFEIQTLVVAELIGTVYYRLMRIRTRDTVLVQVCDLMLRDEARHIEFHSQRVADRQTHWRALGRALWAAQFQMLFLGATHLAWLDHRPALTAIGADRHEFLREARRESAAFLRRAHPAESPFPEIGAGPAGQ